MNGPSNDKRESLRDELRRQASGIEWPGLHRLLDSAETGRFFEEFQKLDEEATKLRRRHRLITLSSALTGTAAIVLGLIQLTYPESADRVALWKWEGGLAVAATLLVLRGLLGHVHKDWLRARLTAERLRLQIFGVVADPDFWKEGAPRGNWQTIEDDEVKSWAEGGRIPSFPRPSGDEKASPAPAAVARFYRRARLESQAAYFKAKEASEKKRFWDDPALVQLVFFASVVLALMHVLMHWAYTRRPDEEAFHHLSVFLLFLSALVPILFTGLRTWRSANESARNAARAHAKHALLVSFQSALDAAKDSWSLFATMQLAESVLEEEQREWLRLMDEAEWI